MLSAVVFPPPALAKSRTRTNPFKRAIIGDDNFLTKVPAAFRGGSGGGGAGIKNNGYLLHSHTIMHTTRHYISLSIFKCYLLHCHKYTGRLFWGAICNTWTQLVRKFYGFTGKGFFVQEFEFRGRVLNITSQICVNLYA